MPALRATDRVRRLLAIVPWVAGRPEGVPVEEVCARFDLTYDQLVGDFDLLPLVGVAPYTPDLLVEVLIEGDRVFVHLPVAFDRPFRLTPDEGLALLAAGASLLSAPGTDPDGPLARALDRLADLLGVDPAKMVHVELGRAEEETLDVVRRAIGEHRRLDFDYYSYGRDEQSRRTVDPYRLWSAAGEWYLAGFCHVADDERIFRLDRMGDAQLLESTFTPPSGPVTADVFTPGPDIPRVVLDLQPAARWVVESYPVEAMEERDEGVLRVTLAVAARPWLERLLVRLGSGAAVVSAPGDLAAAGTEAANRILARYRASDG